MENENNIKGKIINAVETIEKEANLDMLQQCIDWAKKQAHGKEILIGIDPESYIFKTLIDITDTVTHMHNDIRDIKTMLERESRK